MLGNKEIMAENIQYFMEKKGIDRTKLSKDLGIAYSTLSDWINAVKYPRIDKIEIMANYFGISKADLVEKRNTENYYLNDETSQIAQDIFENKELRLLFDAARDAEPEDLETVHSMLLALKRKERGE